MKEKLPVLVFLRIASTFSRCAFSRLLDRLQTCRGISSVCFIACSGFSFYDFFQTLPSSLQKYLKYELVHPKFIDFRWILEFG
jgi:hypothetical protein